MLKANFIGVLDKKRILYSFCEKTHYLLYYRFLLQTLNEHKNNKIIGNNDNEKSLLTIQWGFRSTSLISQKEIASS